MKELRILTWEKMQITSAKDNEKQISSDRNKSRKKKYQKRRDNFSKSDTAVRLAVHC